MASKKTKVVDGYTALKAAQEAARHGKGDPLRAGKTTKPPPKTEGNPGETKAGARIGRTVLPSSREIICPECGYASEIKGKLSLYVCQPCRHRLTVEDRKFDVPFSEAFESGGTLTVTPGGSLDEGARIVGNDVVLQGKMNGGSLRACRRLIVEKGAEPDWDRIQFRDLEVREGVDVTLKTRMEGMHVQLKGRLEAKLLLGGCLSIHPGGEFRGHVKAAALLMEDGAGLNASLDINPDYLTRPIPASTGKKSKTPPKRPPHSARKPNA